MVLRMHGLFAVIVVISAALFLKSREVCQTEACLELPRLNPLYRPGLSEELSHRSEIVNHRTRYASESKFLVGAGSEAYNCITSEYATKLRH